MAFGAATAGGGKNLGLADAQINLLRGNSTQIF